MAVTGKLDNYTRSGIRARLLELGARSVSTVSRKTDYLIAGSKLDRARALGVKVLAEWEFEGMAD